jgi:hypothetical protein
MVKRFKKLHQIVFNKVCGESSDVSEKTIANWVAKLPSITNGYKPKDITNDDETILFLHALPGKAMCLKGEKCSSGKLCKEMLTVFLCGFMTGETEKPSVIGKATKSLRSKNI